MSEDTKSEAPLARPEVELSTLLDAAREIAQKLPLLLDDLQRSHDAYAELLERIAEQVTRMLQRDPEKLLQILYRVDVPEAKVKAAFTQFPALDLAHRLAELLLERQLQKMLLRERFKAFAMEQE